VPRPRAALVALLAVLAALAGAPSVAPAASESTAPVDASAKGGDPYFPWDGNAGYDVRHYDIDTTFTPRDGRLRGRTTLQATAGVLPLRSFSLDLVLTPDWVEVDGRSARFDKPRTHELRVRPSTPVPAGGAFTVSVGYHGKPARIRSTGVSPFVWSAGEAMAIGEPQIGAWWFAANEIPRDKATYDVTIRVPRGQQAVSNGHLARHTVGARWTSWRWRQLQPIVTYLAFFAAGRFELRRSVEDGRATVYAVSKRLSVDQRDRSFRLLQRTPGITRWLEDWLGPYPYDSNGGVVSSLWAGFALENAGRPTYPYVGGPGDRSNVSLVVHEMAHQWFGNDVSLQQWKDIWLNEGLASYAEWRYAERQWGERVHARLLSEHGARYRDDFFWGLKISDPGPARLFDTPIYERGAMTVAALRCRIGEAMLDQTLQHWLRQRSGGHGTDPDFRRLAEQVSGEDLGSFFTAWLDTRHKPAKTAETGLAGCVPGAPPSL
jgi:aminopeptidase N